MITIANNNNTGKNLTSTQKGINMKPIITTIAFILPLLLTACSSDQQAEMQDKQIEVKPAQKDDGTVHIDFSKRGTETKEVKLEYKMSGIPFNLTGTPVSVAGVTFTPAIEWTVLEPSGMRAASYTYGPLENDTDSATLAVFYFGKGSGGSVEDNIERWINQMSIDTGQDPHTATIRYSMDVDGMNTHVMTLMGVYHSPVGGPMSRVKVEKENYRLIGIVVEAPQGNLFFKLTGPDYTARIMTEAFFTMIKTKLKKN